MRIQSKESITIITKLMLDSKNAKKKKEIKKIMIHNLKGLYVNRMRMITRRISSSSISNSCSKLNKSKREPRA